jgi:hypothetical protein
MGKSKNRSARKHTESVNRPTSLEVHPKWALEKFGAPEDNSLEALIRHALEHITTCAVCRAPSTGAVAIGIQGHIPMPLPVPDADRLEPGCLYLMAFWKDGVTTGGLAFLGRCATCRALLTEREVAQRVERYLWLGAVVRLDANG